MIRIRPVQPEDAEAWTALRVALWPDGTAETHGAEVARFLRERPSGPGAMPEAVLVAILESGPSPAVVGFVEVSRRLHAEGCATSPVGFLEGWYVVPERRRAGIGRVLVAAAEQWARDLGCREFASDALADNIASQRAHLKLGFEEVEVLRCFRKSLTTAAPAGTGSSRE